jgi:hypothetical protein
MIARTAKKNNTGNKATADNNAGIINSGTQFSLRYLLAKCS